MRWHKRGLIFNADGSQPWQQQFAMLPTPLLIAPDRLRIYVGFCDAQMMGRIGYVDVNPDNPSQILEVSSTPVLDVGAPGQFDEHGVVPVSVLRQVDKVYLYYVGFQRRSDVPYTMFCGLALSHDLGQSFSRVQDGPILLPTADEPYARCGVHVMQDDHALLRMWYIGSIGAGWTANPNGKALPLYSMKYLESHDPVRWESAEPLTPMVFANADEHGFGRPYVWKERGFYHMLYSIRTYSRGYQIGYAGSADGLNWTRQDELAGLTPEGDSWESENISYPHLFKHGEKTWVFYNGNNSGKTGFGFAELVE